MLMSRYTHLQLFLLVEPLSLPLSLPLSPSPTSSPNHLSSFIPWDCRAQKQVDTLLAELGPKGEPICATQASCAAYLALRADIVQMLELRKRLQHRQAAEASQGGSEGRGRRAHKGKVPPFPH